MDGTHPHSHSSHSHRSSGRHGHREREYEKDGERGSFKVKISGHRSARYKEKFQALRERYDRVIAIHDQHQRDLALADEKIERLKAENDLLLDAIYTAAPELIQLVAPLHGHEHGHDSQHPTPMFSPVDPNGPNNHHDHDGGYPQNTHPHAHTHARSRNRSNTATMASASAQTVAVTNGHVGTNGVAMRGSGAELEDRGVELEGGQSPYDDDGRG